MPHTAKVADELCFIKTMHTEAINHDPGMTFLQTGAQLAGRPSIGAWLSYGLGSMNSDLPTFVVMVSSRGGNQVYDRLWGSGFLPSEYQGVKFLSTGDPVLYLSNPPGVDRRTRRRYLDVLAKLNQQDREAFGDPETTARIGQYEMAYRMQASVPELTDLSDEPEAVFERYGPDSKTPGTFAANCLLARRLAERDVRFIEIFHRGWDHAHPTPDPHPDSGQGCRPTTGGVDPGFERTRNAGRHAGRLGRGVRPHGLLSGAAHRGDLRARPPSTGLHDLDGRGWRQGGHDVRRD